MRILFAIVGHHQRLGVDAVALHKKGQTITAQTRVRHTVVADQRKSRHQNLTRIAGVGQALRIARHGRVEHHLSRRVAFVAERASNELCSVVEYQSCFSLHLIP